MVLLGRSGIPRVIRIYRVIPAVIIPLVIGIITVVIICVSIVSSPVNGVVSCISSTSGVPVIIPTSVYRSSVVVI